MPFFGNNPVSLVAGLFIVNEERLKSLPDISKWNTNNITNMSYIFYDCSSLKSLPDISNWNTNNVTDMSSLFDRCSLLKSLPDISTWNINNVVLIDGLFSLVHL